jgi:hypothetical protein
MFTAKQYRAKAAEYTELLKAASLPAEIREFRKLEQSYLMLAENEEWIQLDPDLRISNLKDRIPTFWPLEDLARYVEIDPDIGRKGDL